VDAALPRDRGARRCAPGGSRRRDHRRGEDHRRPARPGGGEGELLARRRGDRRRRAGGAEDRRGVDQGAARAGAPRQGATVCEPPDGSPIWLSSPPPVSPRWGWTGWPLVAADRGRACG
jgi:hypothetical protein